MDKEYINENSISDIYWDWKLDKIFPPLDEFRTASPFQEQYNEYPPLDIDDIFSITTFCDTKLQTCPILKKDVIMTEKNNIFNIVQYSQNNKKIIQEYTKIQNEFVSNYEKIAMVLIAQYNMNKHY